jgi:hypothetical protein
MGRLEFHSSDGRLIRKFEIEEFELETRDFRSRFLFAPVASATIVGPDGLADVQPRSVQPAFFTSRPDQYSKRSEPDDGVDLSHEKRWTSTNVRGHCEPGRGKAHVASHTDCGKRQTVHADSVRHDHLPRSGDGEGTVVLQTGTQPASRPGGSVLARR